MWKVYRQGTFEKPMICPRVDVPWKFVGACEAGSWDEAIRKLCGDEPPVYNRVWYIALDGGREPELWEV